jgi:hypothetical protein
MVLHLLSQYSFLDLISMFEQLLNDVVAENISHQLQGVGLNLAEQLLFLVTIGGFQLLLDEA